MAELDYAFLADFARVEPGGKLTAIGASWTHVLLGGVQGSHMIHVGGRIRADFDADPVMLSVSIEAPDQLYTLQFDTELTQDRDARPYGDNKVGVVFALGMMVPLPAPGLYRIDLELEHQHVRSLMFTAEFVDGVD